MGLIYVDSCVIIYAIEDHPEWGKPSRLAFAQAGAASLAISPLVKLESLVGPYKRNDGVEKLFEDFFGQITSLEMSEDVYLRAARISANFRLRELLTHSISPARNIIAAKRSGRTTIAWRRRRTVWRATSSPRRFVVGAQPDDP